MATGLIVPALTKIAAIAPGSASTFTVVSCDLSTELGGIDNCQIYAQLLVQGRVTGGPSDIRAMRGLGFTRVGGTVAQLDAATFVLGVDFVSAALVGAAVFIDSSGSSIRGRITTIGAMTRVTGFLSVYASYNE